MPLTNSIILTAYCACKLCCGPHAKGITANGAQATVNKTIAAPRSIPFGTKVIIPEIGTNTYIVQDRLSKRFPSRWDLFINSHKKAKKFGKRQVKVIYELKHASF